MKNCLEHLTKDLFNYVYELLEDKEKIEVEGHTKHCSACRREIKKILKIKAVLIDSPKITFKDKVDIIISKAIEKERSSLFNQLKKLAKKINKKIIYIRNFKFKLRPALISATIMALLLVGIIHILPLKQDDIHIIRAYNNAFINGKKVLSSKINKYDLQNKTDIKVLDGEMTMQIGNKCLISIKKDSEFIIRKNDNFIIDLKTGEIICIVKESALRNRLIIRTGNAKFTVKGTIFSIKNRNNIIDLKVEEGEVKLDLLNNSYSILPNKMVQIKNNKVTHKKVYAPISGLSTLEKENFINNFSKANSLYIDSCPENSRIYKNGMVIVKTPILLTLMPDTKDNYVIYSKGFNPAEINLDEITKNNLSYKLKKMTSSDLLWKYEFTCNLFANPVRINNYLINPGADGTICKYNLEKKEIIWQFKKTGIRIDTTPIFYNNKIYVNSKEGFLYSLDFKSGDRIWKRKIGRLVSSMPFIDKGKIFLGNSNGVLYCLDADMGNIIWKKEFNNGFCSSPIIKDDNLYIGNMDGYIYSINIHTKEIKWKIKTKAAIIGSKPIIVNNTLYLGSSDSSIYAIDINNGKKKWSFNTESEIFTTPLFFNNNIIVTSGDGSIYALDYQDGELKWKYNIQNKISLNPIAKNNKLIAIADKDNNVVHMLSKSGQLYFTFKWDFNPFVLPSAK